MEKIIRAEDLMRTIRDDDRIDGRNFALVKEHIDESVPVDAVEVVHGRWILADDGDGDVCSACGTDFCNLIYETGNWNYCPNCGVPMDGGN